MTGEAGIQGRVGPGLRRDDEREASRAGPPFVTPRESGGPEVG